MCGTARGGRQERNKRLNGHDSAPGLFISIYVVSLLQRQSICGLYERSPTVLNLSLPFQL